MPLRLIIPKHFKLITDEINLVLARHYGFIIHYRMGLDAELDKEAEK